MRKNKRRQSITTTTAAMSASVNCIAPGNLVECVLNSIRDCLYQLHASFLFIFETITVTCQQYNYLTCPIWYRRNRTNPLLIYFESDLARCRIELRRSIECLREVLIRVNTMRLTIPSKHRIEFSFNKSIIRHGRYIRLLKNIQMLTERATDVRSHLYKYLVIRPSRFKQHSVVQQENDNHETADATLAFTIPREYVTRGGDFPSGSLFHGGIDSPSLDAYDPLFKQPVHITKYLCLKSKTSTQQYINHLYERILITSNLSHPNVRRILSWYIADACLYSITGVIHGTLRHAIQSETFSYERIYRLSSQIINGTVYLQSKGLCPLTPWYTTNIELTRDDRIRLCSPTISTTKLNGGIVHHHHLWRHAPESLVRMIIDDETLLRNESFDNSKEDVWSIGCIMIEMMINTIIFRPPNDDPSLQLLCIVQFVGGLTLSLLEQFPLHIKQLFSGMKCDSHQQRLIRLLKQIFIQYTIQTNGNLNEHSNSNTKEHLNDLFKQIFQFQSEKRIALTSILDHSFFIHMGIKQRTNNLKNIIERRRSLSTLSLGSIRISTTSDDLIRLCTKLDLEHPRWMLTLKERCLLELIIHMKNFSQFNMQEYGLSQSLQFELKRLIHFFHG